MGTRPAQSGGFLRVGQSTPSRVKRDGPVADPSAELTVAEAVGSLLKLVSPNFSVPTPARLEKDIEILFDPRNGYCNPQKTDGTYLERLRLPETVRTEIKIKELERVVADAVSQELREKGVLTAEQTSLQTVVSEARTSAEAGLRVLNHAERSLQQARANAEFLDDYFGESGIPVDEYARYYPLEVQVQGIERQILALRGRFSEDEVAQAKEMRSAGNFGEYAERQRALVAKFEKKKKFFSDPRVSAAARDLAMLDACALEQDAEKLAAETVPVGELNAQIRYYRYMACGKPELAGILYGAKMGLENLQGKGVHRVNRELAEHFLDDVNSLSTYPDSWFANLILHTTFLDNLERLPGRVRGYLGKLAQKVTGGKIMPPKAPKPAKYEDDFIGDFLDYLDTSLFFDLSPAPENSNLLGEIARIYSEAKTPEAFAEETGLLLQKTGAENPELAQRVGKRKGAKPVLRLIPFAKTQAVPEAQAQNRRTEIINYPDFIADYEDMLFSNAELLETRFEGPADSSAIGGLGRKFSSALRRLIDEELDPERYSDLIETVKSKAPDGDGAFFCPLENTVRHAIAYLAAGKSLDRSELEEAAEFFSSKEGKPTTDYEQVIERAEAAARISSYNLRKDAFSDLAFEFTGLPKYVESLENKISEKKWREFETACGSKVDQEGEILRQGSHVISEVDYALDDGCREPLFYAAFKFALGGLASRWVAKEIQKEGHLPESEDAVVLSAVGKYLVDAASAFASRTLRNYVKESVISADPDPHVQTVGPAEYMQEPDGNA
ncbi:MAG: hypothetical protein V1820_01035 [archaeon]